MWPSASFGPYQHFTWTARQHNCWKCWTWVYSWFWRPTSVGFNQCLTSSHMQFWNWISSWIQGTIGWHQPGAYYWHSKQNPNLFQAPRDGTYNPECTHNPMAIQRNQYPIPSHNSALPQFLAHHNCDDLDPTDNPSAVPTALQAPNIVPITILQARLRKAIITTLWLPHTHQIMGSML